MATSNKLIVSVVVIILFGLGIFWLTRGLEVVPENSGQNEKENLTTYQADKYGFNFSYPSEWGAVKVAPGNKICPEEDTYRTADTLQIFDQEYAFDDLDLEDTDSIIRSGIRVYRFNPNLTNDCNDGAIRSLAKKEITGPELSSVRLVVVNIPGFYGVRNEDASRLDTEGRNQYLLFIKESDTSVLAIQPYMSFIPFADSPEWKEIDTKYKMNMLGYLQEGETASKIREFQNKFRKMAESIRVR